MNEEVTVILDGKRLTINAEPPQPYTVISVLKLFKDGGWKTTWELQSLKATGIDETYL